MSKFERLKTTRSSQSSCPHSDSSLRSFQSHQSRQRPLLADISAVCQEPSDHANGPFGTSMLLLNAMIGSGILIQAYVFMESGIVLALVEYLIIGTLTYTGIHYLIAAAHQKGIYDYSKLSVEMLGPASAPLVDWSIILITFSSALSSLIFIGTILQSIVDTYLISGWYTDIWFLCGVVVLLFVSPFCLVREFDHLVGISVVSISILGGVMLLVVIDGSLLSHNYSSDALVYADLGGWMESVGFVAFAFSFIQSIFPAYVGLEEREPAVFSYCALNTVVMGITMCLVTGFVGYLSFRSSTQEDILDNFSGDWGIFFKIAVCCHLIFYLPGDFVVLRKTLFTVLGCEVLELEANWYAFYTLALLFFTTMVAVICQTYFGTSLALTIILNIPAGIGNSTLSFVLPGTFLLLLSKKVADPWEQWIGITLIVGGTLICLAGIAGTIDSAISD